MKEENVLTVLMYLFKHHIQESCELDDKLFDQLSSIGFSKAAIHSAFHWLESLTSQVKNAHDMKPSYDSIRVFSPHEQISLNTECQNYLLYLQREKILDILSTELVINQVTQLDPDGIDVSLIQWVTLMVLYNQEDRNEALEKMEFLVLHDKTEALH